MKNLKNILNILRNKYVLTGLIFVIWLSFFDSYSLIKRYGIGKKLKQLEAERKYYRDEVRNDSIGLYELQSGSDNLERFARERYLMKRDSEDIYVVTKKSVPK